MTIGTTPIVWKEHCVQITLDDDDRDFKILSGTKCPSYILFMMVLVNFFYDGFS